MQNCNSSVGTTAQKSSKSRLLFRPATLAAILMLAVCFSSCSPKYKDDYEQKCLELDIKKKQLDYLKELYSVKSDIEFRYKIKKLDSLINDASRLK
jgi:hypothetical protein